MKAAKRPKAHVGAKCGAHGRQKNRPCRNPAGFKTDHPGQGRCHLHGGKSLITHGETSKIVRTPLGELIDKHAANPDPLNTLHELATARALAEDFINRHETFRAALLAWHEDNAKEPKPTQALEIADAVHILAEITKIVERIQKAQAANAVSLPTMISTMVQMGRVVEAHVKDERAREQIRKGWLSIPIA